MSIETVLQEDERFAQEKISKIDKTILEEGLVPNIKRALKSAYFTQFVEDYDINPSGIELDPLIEIYRYGSQKTRHAVLKGIQHIYDNSPVNGRTFINFYVNRANDEIKAINSRGFE